MIRYLWHRLVQRHDDRIHKMSRSPFDLFVLLKCAKCHRVKSFQCDWGYTQIEHGTDNDQITINDFLKKIQGK